MIGYMSASHKEDEVKDETILAVGLYTCALHKSTKIDSNNEAEQPSQGRQQSRESTYLN